MPYLEHPGCLFDAMGLCNTLLVSHLYVLETRLGIRDRRDMAALRRSNPQRLDSCQHRTYRVKEQCGFNTFIVPRN